MLICCTEMNTVQDIESFISVIKEDIIKMKLIFEYEENITGHVSDCGVDDTQGSFLPDLPRRPNSKRTPSSKCERN